MILFLLLFVLVASAMVWGAIQLLASFLPASAVFGVMLVVACGLIAVIYRGGSQQ